MAYDWTLVYDSLRYHTPKWSDQQLKIGLQEVSWKQDAVLGEVRRLAIEGLEYRGMRANVAGGLKPELGERLREESQKYFNLELLETLIQREQNLRDVGQ